MIAVIRQPAILPEVIKEVWRFHGAEVPILYRGKKMTGDAGILAHWKVANIHHSMVDLVKQGLVDEGVSDHRGQARRSLPLRDNTDNTVVCHRHVKQRVGSKARFQARPRSE